LDRNSVRALVTIGLALFASTALAGVPGYSPPTFDPPGAVLILGGNQGGAVDPRARKRIIVRNWANQPVANATVVINLGDCADVRLCSTQPNHPGALFNCPAKTLTAVTNENGLAEFLVGGGATNGGGNAPGNSYDCATLRADGLLLAHMTIAAPDQNGVDGVTVPDLAAWASDRFGDYRGRSDFNGDHVLDVIDLALWAGFRFGGGSESSCLAICP
jgi:hypothetical protein